MTIRASVAAACVLLASVAVSSNAAATPSCPTFSDPKGDASPADSSLDITSVKWRTTSKALTAMVTVDNYASHPLLAPDSRLDVLFTVGATDVVMFWKNGPARAQEANGFHQEGIRVDNVWVGEVDGGWVGNTLTISVKYKDLQAAIGHPVLGKRFSKFSALAKAAYVYQDANVTYDTATAAATQGFVGGAACK